MELLISISIITLSSFYFMGIVDNIYGDLEKSTIAGVLNRIKNGFVEKVLIKIPPESFYNEPIRAQNQALPTAWSKDGKLLDSRKCSECFGKIGYWLNPVDNYPGMYHLHIKFTYGEHDKKIHDEHVVLMRLK